MHDQAVQLDDVSYVYPGALRPAVEHVSLAVAQGERLGVLGPNGGGKSTLLKLILGLIAPTSGTVLVFGAAPQAARRAGLLGYLPQRSDLEPAVPLSVRQVVALAASWRRNPLLGLPTEARARVERLLTLVGAAEFADRPIGRLSGGQLQRALIARALAPGPRLLILDEPTVGIDAAGQQRFAELLRTLHSELGLTILTVSHDLRAVAAGSDRVACLARRLHFHASPQGLTPQVLAELFSHDVAGLAGAAAGMHIHAHGLGEPCPDEAHGASPSTIVTPTISVRSQRP
ncbi:metal ABC transporter ATP-binding protein [soil metagenome]